MEHFRKAKIRKNASVVFKKANYRAKEETKHLLVYMACQYRWEDSADPEIEDKDYFFDLDEAKEYVNNLDLNLGYFGKVDAVTFEYSNFNETFDFRDDFTIDTMVNELNCDYDEVWTTNTNVGNDIEGAIIVGWSWEKYIGYCRNFHGLRYGNWRETENDLSNNADRTFHKTESVLLTKEEIKGLDNVELFEAVQDALSKIDKWNDFKLNPFSTNGLYKIKSDLGLQLEDNVNI
jgi:hypothetical protein